MEKLLTKLSEVCYNIKRSVPRGTLYYSLKTHNMIKSISYNLNGNIRKVLKTYILDADRTAGAGSQLLKTNT